MKNIFRAATLVVTLSLTAPMFAGPIGGVPRPPVNSGGGSGSGGSGSSGNSGNIAVILVRTILGY